MNIALDFDGILVTDKYPEIGEPNWAAVNKVKELKEQGNSIFLWTRRHGELLDKAIEFCKNVLHLELDDYNSTPFTRKKGYVLNKMVADMYIDGKSMNLNDFVYYGTVIKSKESELGLDYSVFKRKYGDGSNDDFIKNYFFNITTTVGKLEAKKKEYKNDEYKLNLVTSLLSKFYTIINDMNETDNNTPFQVEGSDIDEAMDCAMAKQSGTVIVYNDLYILNSLCELANLL